MIGNFYIGLKITWSFTEECQRVMNFFIKKNVFKTVLLCALLLSGCKGGGDSDENSISNPSSKFVTASIVNDYYLIPIGDEQHHRIDLINNIKLSNDYDVMITGIESLNNDQGCKITTIDDSGFIFDGKDPIVCDYQYKIRLKNDNVKLTGDTEGFTRVLMSSNPENAKLIPFGIVAYQGEPVVINIEEELNKVGESHSLDGFQLNEDIVITPVGSSSIVKVDSAKNNITYTSGLSFTGNEQVSYSLKNSKGDIVAGSFIVTVAEKMIHGIDIDEKIEIDAEVNANKHVDISRFINNIDNDYQLIYVNTFGAKVSLTSETNPQNKSFEFEAPMMGNYYVNAVVTDHRGGFDVSLIKIDVSDPNNTGSWPSLWDGLNLFNKPLTTTDAMSDSVSYTSSYFDTDVDRWIAIFDYNAALNYCSTIGRLPTVSELKGLYNNKSPSIRGWPVSLPYWSSDPSKLVDLKGGGEVLSKDHTGYSVTCVGVGDFIIDTKQSVVSNIVADGYDKAKVVVKITFNNEPVKGQSIDLSIPPASSAIPDETTVATDENGLAIFKLSSLKAGKITATVAYKGENRSIDISFIGDVKTASLSLNNLNSEGVNIDDEATVEGVLIDVNNNAVPGEVITFTSSNPRSEVTNVDSNTTESGRQKANVRWTDPNIPEDDQRFNVYSDFTRPDGTLLNASTVVTFLVAEFKELIVVKNNENIDGGSNILRSVFVKPTSGEPKPGVEVRYKSSSEKCKINGEFAHLSPVSVKSDLNGFAEANITFGSDPAPYLTTGFDCDISASYGNTTKTEKIHFSGYVCGGIDNKEDNASGNCVKVATMTSGELFTAAPSEAFWNNTLLAKTNIQDAINSTVGPTPMTIYFFDGFAAVGLEKVATSTTRAKFNPLATKIVCDAYNELKLAGRTNWEPSSSKAGAEGGNWGAGIIDTLGSMASYNWPVVRGYTADRYILVSSGGGGAWNNQYSSNLTMKEYKPTGDKAYPSCMSK
ncbi:TPA: Ig-like domain-containing protein [Photobacterium damselae]